MQTTKSIHDKFLEVRGKVRNKHVVLLSLNYEDNVFNLVVLEPKVNQENMA